MPFVLVIIGLLLIVTAIRGTHGRLWNLLYEDVTGTGDVSGFVVWLVAILTIGFLGYYKPLETPAKLLLGLVVLGIFLSNGGVFEKLSEAFTNPLPQAAAPAETEPLPQEFPVKLSGQGGKGGGAGGIVGKVAETAIGALIP